MNRSLKRIVKRVANAAGYEVRSSREVAPYAADIRHAEVFPAATYSPWLSDEEFNRVYDLVKNNTLVDRYRCYELWQLVGEMTKIENGDLIEIGTWRGGTGALIGRKCQIERIPGVLYLCDTFAGVVKAGPLDATYFGGEHADTTKQAVLDLIDSLGLDRVRILQGTFPDESAAPLADARFRFCHIDVDVYESAKEIVDWIWPRLVPGGIIVYDDYGFHCCVGITRFVNEERRKPDRLVIHNLNGHAIVIKLGEKFE
jgi:O-methyltransferase